jgi:hypothetical protein
MPGMGNSCLPAISMNCIAITSHNPFEFFIALIKTLVKFPEKSPSTMAARGHSTERVKAALADFIQKLKKLKSVGISPGLRIAHQVRAYPGFCSIRCM